MPQSGAILYKSTVLIAYVSVPAATLSDAAPMPLADAPLRLELCGWSVPAGFPSPAADHTRKRIDLNEHLIGNKEATFLFRVKGDSMTGAGIYEEIGRAHV